MDSDGGTDIAANNKGVFTMGRIKNVRRSRFLLWTLATFLLAMGSAKAVVLGVNQHDDHTEHLGVTGAPSGRNAPFRVLVPHDWKGALIVYAHGTGSATKLQSVSGPDGDTVVPILDPDSGLPIIGVTPLINIPGTVPGNQPDPNPANDELEREWLHRGYALAASDFKPDPRFLEEGKLGWVVKDAVTDTFAATLQARRILRFRHGHRPERTMLLGRSQGSIAALNLGGKSTTRWAYDAILTQCTVGAGVNAWDQALGIAIAFDEVFGWPSDWGTLDGEDIPAGLSFATHVAPTLVGLLRNPANFPKLEFIRLVNGLPFEGFYPPGNPLNPTPGNLEFNWLFAAFLFLTEVRADLVNEAGGVFNQNIGHDYDLSDEDIEYLRSIGLLADDVETYLDAMNTRPKIQADPSARKYARRFADFPTKLRKKVLSMHTTNDGLVIPANESALADRVEAAGKSENLTQVYTPGFGHCAFTPDQLLAAVDAMESWLDTGQRPDPADEYLFPPASPVNGPWTFPWAIDGFDANFVVPDWPQPLAN